MLMCSLQLAAPLWPWLYARSTQLQSGIKLFAPSPGQHWQQGTPGAQAVQLHCRERDRQGQLALHTCCKRLPLIRWHSWATSAQVKGSPYWGQMAQQTSTSCPTWSSSILSPSSSNVSGAGSSEPAGIPAVMLTVWFLICMIKHSLYVKCSSFRKTLNGESLHRLQSARGQDLVPPQDGLRQLPHEILRIDSLSFAQQVKGSSFLLQNRPHLQLALEAAEDEAVLLHVRRQDHLDDHLAQPFLHQAGTTMEQLLWLSIEWAAGLSGP